MNLGDRAAVWWSAWKYVAVLALLLALSAAANVMQLRKAGGAKEACRAQMVDAARIAIENERKRAAKDERRAVAIAKETRKETARSVSRAQGDTHVREAQIQRVAVDGSCRMPVGLPDLDPAVDAANAAAGD